MERIIKSLAGFRGIFLVGVLLMTGAFAVSGADTDQDTLKQDLADLQKNPSDQALREKIIKLVLGMKTKPAVPEEVKKREGAAEYAFKNAKKESDYADAAAEYEKALLLAPWLADDYFNGGACYEKAGKLKDAIRCFNLYLLAAPDAKDADDVRKRIGGLEFAAEKAEKEFQAKDKEKADAEAKQRQTKEVLSQLKKIVGGADYERWYACQVNPNTERGTRLCSIGLNEQEYYGKGNWYGWPSGTAHERYIFENERVLICWMTDDGIISRDFPELIGTLNGPTIKDIIWERPQPKEGKGRQVWAIVDEKNGDITWSEERPVNNTDYDPKVRYDYTWYKRH